LLIQAPFLVLKLFVKNSFFFGEDGALRMIRDQEIAARMRQGKLELPLDVP